MATSRQAPVAGYLSAGLIIETATQQRPIGPGIEVLETISSAPTTQAPPVVFVAT